MVWGGGSAMMGRVGLGIRGEGVVHNSWGMDKSVVRNSLWEIRWGAARLGYILLS